MNESVKAEANPDLIDRVVEAVSKPAKFYFENQHLLYRPVIWLSVICNAISLIFGVRYFESLFESHSALGGWAIWYAVHVLVSMISIALALRAKKRIDEKRTDGLTYFAVMLGCELLNFNVLIVCAGLYALLNERMRDVLKEGAWVKLR